MSQTKGFKFVFCRQGSYGRPALVLDSELSEEGEVSSKCSQLEKGSFHRVLGSLTVVNDEKEWINDKKTGEGETQKMARNFACILVSEESKNFRHKEKVRGHLRLLTRERNTHTY